MGMRRQLCLGHSLLALKWNSLQETFYWLSLHLCSAPQTKHLPTTATNGRSETGRREEKGTEPGPGHGGSLFPSLEPAALENSFSLPSHVSSLGSLSRETLGSSQDKIKWWRDGCIKPRMRTERRLVTPKGEGVSLPGKGLGSVRVTQGRVVGRRVGGSAMLPSSSG